MDERVVVGVDGSSNSIRALAWAAADAAARGAVLQAAIVWQPDAGSGGGSGGGASEAEARLDRALAEVAARTGDVAVEKVVLGGETAPMLCELAAGASVLVVGWRGYTGVTGAVLGSVSLRCVRRSPCPVVVVNGEHHRSGGPSPGRIVVGIDRSPGSAAALGWALEEARCRRWEIDAVEVGRDPYQEDMALELDMPHFRRERPGMVRASRERLEQFVADVAGTQPPVAIRPLLLDGDPDTKLCERSADADLLVVGSRGRGGLARVVLGSVSSHCAHHSRCPVAIIPAGAPAAPAPGD